MSGLFSTLNVGKSGMFTSQQSIDVTSHNISNSNTEGYSRQRAKIVSSRPMNNPSGVGQIGTGAQVQAIERVRDSFLDYQVRNESGVYGKFQTRSNYLSEIESVFNEPSDTGLSSLIGRFFDSWQELSKQPQSSNNRTVVAQQTVALTDTLNHTAKRLKELQANAQSMIKNTVTDVNSVLNQIDQLNKEITNVKVSGNNPNDLMDKRDLLLDQLSNNFGIVVDKKDFEGIDVKPSDIGGMKSPGLVNANPNEAYARFSYVNSIEKDNSDPSGNTYKITYYELGNMESESNMKTVNITGVTPEKLKQIEENRVLWADKDGMVTKADGSAIRDGATINSTELMVFNPSLGNLAGNISIQKDINNYREQLDKLAKSIAFSVNAVHSGLPDATDDPGIPDKDYMPLFVNSGIAKYSKDSSLLNVEETLYGEENITAENITLNKEILDDVMKLKTKTHDSNYPYSSDNYEDGESDGQRALAIAKLRNSLIKIQDVGVNINSRKDLFNVSKGGNNFINYGMEIENNINGMTLDGYFKDTIDRLGVQAQEANRMVENQEELLGDMTISRESVSGVSLDDEMVNLVQFQHAYNASAKVISTVDELLDVVINGLKR